MYWQKNALHTGKLGWEVEGSYLWISSEKRMLVGTGPAIKDKCDFSEYWDL